MKTFFILRNKNIRPSTFYRITQYIDFDNFNNKYFEYENGLYYKINSKNKLIYFMNKIINLFLVGYTRRLYALCKILFFKGKYNLVIQREVFPKFIDPISLLILKRVVVQAENVLWDFDDNILDLKEITKKEFDMLSELSSHIFVGNKFLKSKINSVFHEKVKIINTSDMMMNNIDLESLSEKRMESFDKEIILSWVGTKKNLIHLKPIINSIDESIEFENKKIVLRIVSDGSLKIKTKKLVIKNVKWSRQTAMLEFEKSHIGLMPLNENEITKGKCAFKAVQSIAMGLPVIISNVGMNKDVINNNGYLVENISDWGTAIKKIISDKNTWKKYSENSRLHWETEFSAKNIQSMILNTIGGEK